MGVSAEEVKRTRRGQRTATASTELGARRVGYQHQPGSPRIGDGVTYTSTTASVGNSLRGSFVQGNGLISEQATPSC